MKKFILLVVSNIILTISCFAQNSLNSGDFVGGSWGVGQAMSSSVGGSLIITKAVSSAGDKYFRFYGDGSPCGEYQPNTNGDFFTHSTTVTTPNENCGSSNAWRINVPTSSSNVVFKTDGGNDGIDRSVAFVIQGTPITVSSVSQNPTSGNVNGGSSVVVTATLSASLPTGQAVYLRYTKDAYSTSTVTQMTGSGTTYTATIPASFHNSGSNVSYYVFTSGDANVSSNGSNADFYTINLNNNSGSNYTYTVSTTFFSTGSVAPNTLTNWKPNRDGTGTSPSNFTSNNVTYVVQNGHSMTTSSTWAISGTGTRLQVEDGGILTSTSAITLAAATTFQIDNGGTYRHANNTAYGTTIFQGIEQFAVNSTVELNNSSTTGPSSVVFGNLIVNFTTAPSGSVNCAGGVTTINGNLDVQFTNTRTFVFTGSTALELNIAGNVTVGAGALLQFSNGTGTPIVNVGGNVNISGTSAATLTVASNSGTNPQLNVTGNVTIGNNGTLTIQGNSGFGYLNVVGNLTMNSSTAVLIGTGSSSSNRGVTITVGGNLDLSSGSVNGTYNSTGGSIAFIFDGGSNSTPSCTLGATFNASALAAVSFIASGGKTVTWNTNFTIPSNRTFSTNGGNFILSAGVIITNNGISVINNGYINFPATAIISGSGSFNLLGATSSLTPTATVNLGGNNLSSLSSATGIIPGMSVSGTGIQSGSFVLYVSGTTVFISKAATVAGTGVTITFSASTGSLITANTAGITTSSATGSVQTTTRTYSTSANYTFNGTAAQVTGNGFTGANNLTIYNSAGVSLSTAAAVTGTLTFTTGKLDLGANNLTLTGATVSGATSSNYIVTSGAGRILRSIANTPSSFVFPIGRNTTNYTPLRITNTGGNTAIYTVGAANTTYTPSADGANVQWSITSNASTTSDLAFQWLTADAGTNLNASPSSGKAYQYNGSTWDNRGGTTTGTPNATTVTGITDLTNPTWTVAMPPAVADIAISANAPAAGNIVAASTNNIIYGKQIVVTTANTSLTDVTVNTTGTDTYAASAATDLTNFKLWINTTNSLSGATQLGSTITNAPALGGTLAFTSGSNLPYSVTTATGTYYLFVTCDVASGAVPGRLITISSTAFSNINFSSGNKTGSDPVVAGNAQTIISAPTVTTNAASSIATTSVVLNGTVNANANSTIASFDYGTTMSYGTNVVADQSPITGTNNESISKTISGLNTNTLYNYVAKGVNDAGTTNGSNTTFTTLSNAPVMDDATGRSIASTTFVANWTAPSNSGSETFTYTVEVSTDNSSQSNFTTSMVGAATQSGIASGNLSTTITGLSAGTTYYYRVKAVNAGGSSAYSAISTSVTTTNPVAPTITTGTVSANSITASVATIAGNNVTNDGGSVITARGLVYNTTTPAETGGAAVPLGSGTTGSFDQSLSGLSSNTLYYVKAYATNGIGTSYGSEVSFTTLATEPTVASTVAFGTKTNTSLVIDFTGGNGARRFVVVRAANNTFSFAPTDRIALTGTISTNFSTATDQGGGDKIVYDGTGTTVTVTNLSTNTAYFVAVYEYTNNSASSPNYYLTPGTGNTTTYNPTITVSSVTAFGNQITGTSSASKSYTVSGNELVSDITVTRPSALFEISTDNSNFTQAAITLAKNGSDAVPTTTIYVRFSPASANGATGALNITHASTDATTQNVVVSGNAIAIQPATEGSISFGTVTTTSIVVNLPTVGNGGKRLVVVKSGSAVDANPANATSYTANATFGTGTQIGTGNYVVYNDNGSGSSVFTVTGLTRNTTYHFAVFEYNEGTGSSQNYLTPSVVVANQQTANASFASDEFRSFQTGDWNSTGTWQSLSGGSWIAATLTPDASASTITIRNTHVVTVTADVSIDQAVIETTGQLLVNEGVTLTAANGTGNDILVYGILKNSGTLTLTGTMEVFSQGMYDHAVSGATISIPTVTNITWNTGSTLKISGTYSTATAVQAGSLIGGISYSYANVLIDCNFTNTDAFLSLSAGTLSIDTLRILNTGNGEIIASVSNPTVCGTYLQTGGLFYCGRNNESTRNLTVNGNVTISGGALHVKNQGNGGSGQLFIGGNLTVGLNGTLTNSGTAANARINFTGSSPQTWNNEGTFSATGSIGFLIEVTGSGGVTLNDNITLPIGGIFTLTSGNFTVAANKTLNISGSSTFNNTSGRSLIVNGTVQNTSSGIATFTGAGALIIANGGTYINSGATPILSTAGAITVESGGTFVHNTTTGIATPLNNFSIASSSNFIYRGSSSLSTSVSISNRTFGNLSFESTSGTWSPSLSGTSNLTVNGSMSIGGSGAGNVNTGAGYSGNISIVGNVSINSGSTMAFAGDYTVGGNWTNNGTFTHASGKTVTFNGTSSQTITKTGGESFNNLTITNTAATITANNNISVGGTFTTNASTNLNMGSNTLTVNNVAHSGALQTQNTSATPITTGKTWGGLVTYNGGTQTMVAGNYNNVTLNNTSTALAASGSVAGTLTLTSGTLTVGSSNTLTIGSGGAIAATSGSLATGSSGGTIAFAGTGTISGTLTFNNVTLAGGVNFGSSSTIGANGTLQLNIGGFVTGNAPEYASSATLIYNNTGSYNRTLEWSATSGKGYPGNVLIQNGTTVNTQTLTADIGVANNLTLGTTGSEGSLNMSNSTAKIIVGGNVQIGGTTGTSTLTLSSVAGGDIKVGGNWNRNANGAFTSNARAIFFTGSGTNELIATGGESVGYLVVEKTGGSVKLLNNLTITADNSGTAMSIPSAASFDLNGNTLSLNGTNQSIILADGGVVNFIGAANSTIAISNAIKTISTSNSGTVVFGSNILIAASTGINFGNNLSTVNGTFRINSGGFVSTNPPIYGPTSTLQYNANVVYGRGAEWSTNSGAGYPANVQLSNNTTLNYPNTGNGGADPFSTNLSIAGNLTIDNGSALYLGYGDNGNKSGSLTVAGNVTINGPLGLGNAAGGDLFVGGNWIRAAANADFFQNGRTVTFNGTGAQSISRTGGETFANTIVVNKASGVLTGNNNITFQNDLTLTSGTIDDGGNTLTVNGNIVNTGTHSSTGSGKLVLNGTSKTISGATLGNVEIASSSISLSGNPTINGVLTLTNSLDLASNGRTLNLSNTSVVEAGTNQLTGTGTVNVNGVFKTARTQGFSGANTSIPSATVNLDALSTVEYAATAAQTITARTDYKNVTLTGSAIKTLAGTTTVAATLLMANATDILSVANNTLTLNGTVTGSGRIRGGTSSNLVIGGTGSLGTLNFDQTTDGTSNVLNSFTLNRTASGAASLGNKLVITNVYTPTAGTLTTNTNLHLRSTAANTARIAPGDAAGGYITGDVTVERYISATLNEISPGAPHNRAWRMLTPGVNTSTTINANWQEGKVNTSVSTNIPADIAGYGVHITGTGGSANGFDVTQTNAASLYEYDQPTQAWALIGNTNVNTLNAKKGYLLFVRGNRDNLSPINTATGNSNVVIRAKGTLLQGTQTFTGLATANNFSLVTNPFASPINWSDVYTGANATNFDAAITIWDPNIGTRGGFVTVNEIGISSNGASYLNEEIQSGQAFFIQTKPTVLGSPSFTIEENHKSTTNNLTVFRTANQLAKLKIQLRFTASNVQRTADGVVAVFANNYSNAVDGNDAEQIVNWDEDIALLRNGKELSIESRNTITANDTLFLKIGNLRTAQANYTWVLQPEQLNAAGLEAFLQDNFTNTTTPISLTAATTINFSVSSNAASTAANRFRIVFRNAAALPVTISQFTAQEKDQTVTLVWQTVNEQNIQHYEVERSSNAQEFTKLATVTSNASATSNIYQHADARLAIGTYYYRLKIVEKDGKHSYSKVVQITIGKGTINTVSVYPNPIKGNTINLQLNNVEKGNYTIKLYNYSGQVVYQSNMQHAGGSAVEPIVIGKTLPAGQYELELRNDKNIRMLKSVRVE